MAERLQRLLRSDACPAGFSPTLHVYNRSLGKAQPLTGNPELASVAVGSPGELASCAVTFCMLAEDKAVQQASM